MCKSLIIILLLTIFCNIQTIDGGKDELVKECLEFLKLTSIWTAMPYENYGNLLHHTDETELNGIITRGFAELICSYVLGAKIYMKLIEDFLTDDQLLFQTFHSNPDKCHDDLTFTKEANLMNVFVNHCDRLKNNKIKDVLGLFHVYTLKVSAYIKSKLYTVHGGNNQTSITVIHNSMKTLIDRSYESVECQPYIAKNNWNSYLINNLNDRYGSLVGNKLVMYCNLLGNVNKLCLKEETSTLQGTTMSDHVFLKKLEDLQTNF